MEHGRSTASISSRGSSPLGKGPSREGAPLSDSKHPPDDPAEGLGSLLHTSRLSAGSSGGSSHPVVASSSTPSASSSTSNHQSHGPICDSAVLRDPMQPPDLARHVVPSSGSPGAADSSYQTKSAVLSSTPAAAAAQQPHTTVSGSSSSGGSLLAGAAEVQEVQPGQLSTLDKPSPSAPAWGTGSTPAAAQAPVAAEADSQRPAPVEGARLSLFASPTPAGGTSLGATSPVVASGRPGSGNSSSGGNSNSSNNSSTSSTSRNSANPSSHLSQSPGQDDMQTLGHISGSVAKADGSGADSSDQASRDVSLSPPAAVAAHTHSITVSGSSAGGISGAGLLAAPGEVEEMQLAQVSTLGSPLPPAPASGTRTTPLPPAAAAEAPLLADADNLEGSRLRLWASPSSGGGASPDVTSPVLASRPTSGNNNSTASSSSSTCSHPGQGSSQRTPVLGDAMRLPDQAMTGPEPGTGGPGADSTNAWPKSTAPSGTPAAAAAQQHPILPVSSTSASDGGRGGNLLAAFGERHDASAVLPSAPDSPSACAPACEARTPSAAAQAPLAVDASSSPPANLVGSHMDVRASPLFAGSSGSPSRPMVVSSTTSSSTSSHHNQGGAVLSDAVQPPDQASGSLPKAGDPGDTSSGKACTTRAVLSSAPPAAGPQLDWTAISRSGAGDGLLAGSCEEQEVQPGQVSTTDSPLPGAPACDPHTPPTAAPEAQWGADASSSLPDSLEGSRLRLWASPTAGGGTTTDSSCLGAITASTATNTSGASSSSGSASGRLLAPVVPQGQTSSNTGGGGGSSSGSSVSSSLLLVPDPLVDPAGMAAAVNTEAADGLPPESVPTASASSVVTTLPRQRSCKPGFASAPRPQKLPGGRYDLISAHTLPLRRYLADLCTQYSWDGALAPFLARCILPSKDGTPSALTPGSSKGFIRHTLGQHILTAAVVVACQGISDDTYDDTGTLVLDDAAQGGWEGVAVGGRGGAGVQRCAVQCQHNYGNRDSSTAAVAAAAVA
jgi:hypothetical protein